MDEPDENSKQSDYNDTKIANDENSTNLSTQNSGTKSNWKRTKWATFRNWQCS